MPWPFNLLYGSVAVEFESRFELEKSVARLAAATRRFAFMRSTHVAVGEVSQTWVPLHRVMPLVRNPFAVHFVGEFREQQNRVVLTGSFEVRWVVQIFMTIWLAFAFIGGVASGFFPGGDARHGSGLRVARQVAGA
jgi:hypothetical protein